MIYRTLAGEKVSQLGFGAMRLPQVGEIIDEAEAIRLLRYALDAGVNYVDTAWVYHKGFSEGLVGKALKGGYREKALIATKSPLWFIESEKDFQVYLDQQLVKLQVDCIDFYLLHALNEQSWAVCQKQKAIEFCERMKKAGKIRHFGFSFHDELPVFKRIVDAYNWEFCQIQYNYLDRNEQAGLAGLQYARARNIDVIVMEPLRGGKIVTMVPPAVNSLWQSSPYQRSAVQWGLGWVFNHPEISLVLSGMSNMAQLVENLAIAATNGPDAFTPAELRLIDQTEVLFRQQIKIGCTACAYCLPCPAGVNIPHNFKIWNEFYMFGQTNQAREAWQWLEEKERADQCNACGRCLSHCPQQIRIPEELKKMVADFVH